jgi:uncharacterized phiE125 gp8 family phage protein
MEYPRPVYDGKPMRYRSLRTVTQPVVEPVSLAEAKAHCRIDSDADDFYVVSLITAAREWVETYMDEALIHQQLVMRLDGFPAEIELPRPPMATSGTATAVSVTFTSDVSGATAALSSSTYRVDRDTRPGVIRNTYGGAWPGHLTDYNSVTVTWWAGRGESGSSVPQGIRNAILMLVGHFYERRLAADSGSLNDIPYGVKALLDAQRWGSYQ